MRKIFIIVKDGLVESVTGDFNPEDVDVTIVDMDDVANNIELKADMEALEKEALSYNSLI